MMQREQILTLFDNPVKPLLLDGAIGSLMQQQGVDAGPPLWSTALTKKDLHTLLDIHSDYIDAGADIITTNTFRTNPAALKRAAAGIEGEEVIKKTVMTALMAVGAKKIIIAGSNPPAEDCYQRERTLSPDELYQNHETHIDLLQRSGCDIILCETLSHMDEINILGEIFKEEDVPFIISLYFDENLKLLSGEPIDKAIETAAGFNPLAVGINCVSPNLFTGIMEEYAALLADINWGFYLNTGSGKQTDKEIRTGINALEYGRYVNGMLKYKPSFVGSCCGSTPEHTEALREVIDEYFS